MTHELCLEGNILFIFSGSSTAPNIIELEKKALIFLFTNIQRNHHIKGFVTLCTDSKILEEDFLKARAGFSEEIDWEDCDDWINLVSSNNFKVKFLLRNYLLGADKLAKEGRSRPTLLHAWC